MVFEHRFYSIDIADTHQVFEADGDVWDCMLNQVCLMGRVPYYLGSADPVGTRLMCPSTITSNLELSLGNPEIVLTLWNTDSM